MRVYRFDLWIFPGGEGTSRFRDEAGENALENKGIVQKTLILLHELACDSPVGGCVYVLVSMRGSGESPAERGSAGFESSRANTR